MEVVDSLQRLPDQARDLGLGQQLVGYAVVKYLSTSRTAWTGDKKECVCVLAFPQEKTKMHLWIKGWCSGFSLQPTARGTQVWSCMLW